jgi:cytochrome c oxidase subunit 2
VIAALMLAAAIAGEPRAIKVSAERFTFTPAVIEVKAGETVVLEITTLDRKHGFQVPDLGIDEVIEPGKITRVKITAPAIAGRVPFHCSVFCGSGHEEMAGEIVVTP